MTRITFIIGGEAASFFSAIHATDTVILLEKSNQLLTKVRNLVVVGAMSPMPALILNNSSLFTLEGTKNSSALSPPSNLKTLSNGLKKGG